MRKEEASEAERKARANLGDFRAAEQGGSHTENGRNGRTEQDKKSVAAASSAEGIAYALVRKVGRRKQPKWQRRAIG